MTLRSVEFFCLVYIVVNVLVGLGFVSNGIMPCGGSCGAFFVYFQELAHLTNQRPHEQLTGALFQKGGGLIDGLRGVMWRSLVIVGCNLRAASRLCSVERFPRRNASGRYFCRSNF